MRKELEERLFAEFPRLYSNREPETSRMCDGFACGDGWFDLIHELSAKLEALGNPDLVAFQVKQKMGSLRFYLCPGFLMDPTGQGMVPLGKGRDDDPRATALIRGAQRRSREICEVCGAEGSGRGVPSTILCADHAGGER